MPGLALYCPPEEARTLIILTALFLMGRMLFWVGYHYNPYMRAFGFGITFYPTVAVYLWLILYHGVRDPRAALERVRLPRPAANAAPSSTGQTNISTLSVRLSLIMKPTNSSSAIAISTVSQTGETSARQRSRTP